MRAERARWRPRHLCGRAAAAPWPRPGGLKPPRRPEGGAGSSGPAVLEGASSLAEAPWNAAPARQASQEPEGTLFAPWRRRGHARRRRRRLSEMSCPHQHWAPPEVTQKSAPGLRTGRQAALGGMEGRWNEATVRFGSFPWIHVLHIPRRLLYQRND